MLVYLQSRSVNNGEYLIPWADLHIYKHSVLQDIKEVLFFADRWNMCVVAVERRVEYFAIFEKLESSHIIGNWYTIMDYYMSNET